MSSPRKTCFVIMPFSTTSAQHTAEYWTQHFEVFLRPLIERNPLLEAHRSEPLRVDILGEIIKDLVFSRIVVADLTDANPNVYWELGVRQSFAHGTVTIIDHPQKPRFDVGVKGTLTYFPNDHVKMKAFEQRFLRAIADCLEHPKTPDSHVLQTISGRGSIYEIIHKEEMLRRMTALASELDECDAVLKNVIGIVRSNAKIKAVRDWSFGARRFAVPAIQTLVTDRYLDADDSFYRTARELYRRIIQWNDELNMWQLRPKPTHDWLKRAIGLKRNLAYVIKDFRFKVAAERDALGKRM